ncbi:LacI family DNA-binding transcriptional regulator [Nocardioides antri]|uniref:LacI family transcriptional regulator n=1 Tax=Nocardioides antri TaxID=2607659 RepID=A0A5B1MBC3_9ACTN|nr:LacI family DNA-binding transcriptional regulator [Nocardioides antri]KAA1429227.1 LacI family transcriptional regulator [Nocardioides antri]
MPARRVTIRDVARAAGVSTTTVSAALTGNGRVSPETRDRIMRVAEECGYVASAAARSLRLGRSGAIGLYVPDRTVGFEYYAHLSRGAAEAALAHGFALTLLPAWPDAAPLRTLHLDGLIVCDPALGDPVAEVLRSLPVPMVTCERDPEPGASPAGVVASDHVAGTTVLLDHLAGQGAASIAALVPGEETSFGQETRRACRESDHDVRMVEVPLAYDPDDIARALAEARADEPDAIMVVPDGGALVALHLLQAEGVRVPEDLLLASYVDALSLQVARPTVTAVDIDPRATGASAVNALVDLVVGEVSGPVLTSVPTHLRVRESTSPA